MSEENKNNPYTSLSKLSDSELTSMLSNVKEGDMQILARLLVEMKNENAEAHKRAKIQSYVSIGASCVCVIILLVVLFWGMKFVPQIEQTVANANNLILAVNEEVDTVSKTVNEEVEVVTKAIDETVAMINQTSDMMNQAVAIVDETNKIIGETGKVVEQANSMMGEVQDVVTNLDKSSQELAATDIDGMLENVNALVETSEKSVQDTVKKIDDIDLDSLNKAIKDLSTVISPLAKLFKK